MFGSDAQSENIRFGSPLIILILIGICIVGVVFLFLKFAPQSNAQYQEFVQQYAESNLQAKEVANSSFFDFGKLQGKNTSRDFASALSLVSESTQNNTKAHKKIEDLVQKIVKLKQLTIQFSDEPIRASAFKLIALLEERNQKLARINDFQKQLFDVLSPFYLALSSNQQPSVTPDFNNGINLIQNEINALNQLQVRIDEAYNEFVGVANIDTSTVGLKLQNNTSHREEQNSMQQQLFLEPSPTVIVPTESLKEDAFSISLKVSSPNIKVMTSPNNFDTSEKSELSILYENKSLQDIPKAELILTHDTLILKNPTGMIEQKHEGSTTVFDISNVLKTSSSSATIQMYAPSAGKFTIQAQLKINDLTIPSNQIVLEAQ